MLYIGNKYLDKDHLLIVKHKFVSFTNFECTISASYSILEVSNRKLVNSIFEYINNDGLDIAIQFSARRYSERDRAMTMYFSRFLCSFNTISLIDFNT